MTVLSYHSTLFSNIASGSEAAGTTSSQILLSRGVAGADTNPPSPRPTTPPFVASIYESESAHIMMVGNAATRILPSDFGGESSNFDAGNAAETAVSRLKAEEVACLSSPTPIPAKIRGALADQLYQASVEDEIPASAKGKGKEIERGRSLERRPRYPNPLARAESWSRRNDAAIEVDVGPIEKRALSRSNTFFEDPSDPCGALDDHVLEPCPSTSICSSVSEVLDPVVHEAAPRVGTFRSSTWSLSQVSPKEQIPRPLTAVSNDCRPLFPEPALPVDQASLAHPDISQLEDIATQTSHAAATVPLVWPRLLSKLPERPPGVASTLPTEILQQIYHHLSPTDFNSARRTCRPWYLNSLHGTLLKTMLRRGGFSSRIPTGSPGKPIRGLPPPLIDEWQMSKEIARESALGPDWTGNGLRKQSQTETGDSDKAPSPFMQTSKVDFTEVATHYPGPHSAGIIFTVSSCGRFLMAANGCMVFIYALNRNSFGPSPGSLRPITSMICPRRVLATSMDTSSHRYAIAVLMDGRMGLVCDISNINLSLYADSPGSNGSRSSSGKATDKKASRVGGAPFLDRTSLNSASPATRAGATKSEPPFVFPGIATTGASVAGFDPTRWPNPLFSQADVPVHMRTAGPSSHHDFLPRANIVNPDEQFPNFGDPVDEVQGWCPATMPVETGPRSLYRNLCSEDDPPRSVAICPQRRCVAFGCSSGIELHWVDALTGQDLNRWFPLTAPSDFLYFLPPRKSIDSAKKLRLISSASRPGERPAITDRSFGPHHRNSSFWENITSEERRGDSDLDSRGILARLRGDARRAVVPGRMDSSDHYKALPLSDGYHILFMDPATGFLCLGSDAPVGGPTKLLRKIWFKGQTGLGSPVSYAGGSDLSFGVRVVAAYGTGAQQSIWLYSVPNDIFVANQSDYFVYPMSYLSTSSVPPDSKRNEWVKWWPDDGLQEWLNHSEDPISGVLPRSIWPVKIRGQMIGTCNGLVDLAIDSGPDMIIWAFSKDGTATVWKLGDGTDLAIRKVYVMRDGTVRDGDSEGDVEMVDAPAPSPDILERPLPLVPDTFDGAASFTSASTATYWKPTEVRRHLILREDSLVQYDADGDVIMCEIDDSRRRREERQSWKELVFEHFGGEVWY